MKLKTLWLRCADFQSTMGCCTSCHEDDDMGYVDLMAYYPPDKHGNEKAPSTAAMGAFLCCGVANDDPDRAAWAKAFWSRRRGISEDAKAGRT